MSTKLHPGQIIGGHEITGYIGSGGSAEVYRAKQANTGEPIAIKILLPGMIPPDELHEFEARFMREATLLTAFGHPNILPVYDHGQADNYYYIAMKLLPSGSLEELISHEGMLPVMRTRKILAGVASALDYVHERGVIHRDMKPSNIMLDVDDTPYIADFGIAKVQNSIGLTSPGVVLGSVVYMAPEKMSSSGFDHRIDIFALGLITFEMLMGRLPIKEKSSLAYYRRYVLEDLPIAAQLTPLIGETAAQTVQRAVHRNPEQRFQTAGDFAAAFVEATAP